MSAVVHEEAATDEVVALASAIAHLPHGPARSDAEDDEFTVGESLVPGEPESAHPLPRQRDEFTCGRCFLVAHVSRRTRSDGDCCTDCN